MAARDISELVQSYAEHKDHERTKTNLDCQGKQGHRPDLIMIFMKNNKLSGKQATTLNTVRYNVTKSTF